ncbi:MAG: hypothetical protein LKM40_01885 [Mageeibacillus sp.]|nr:hypothetical protein [Mageeibacillus sp.]
MNDEIFGGSSDLLEELEHVNSGYCNKGIGNSDANKLLRASLTMNRRML